MIQRVMCVLNHLSDKVNRDGMDDSSVSKAKIIRFY